MWSLKREGEFEAVTKMPKYILGKIPHLDIIVSCSVLNQ